MNCPHTKGYAQYIVLVVSFRIKCRCGTSVLYDIWISFRVYIFWLDMVFFTANIKQ